MKTLMNALLLVALLALLSTGAAAPGKSRLTVINKSGMKIAVQLNGSVEEEFYYLTVPEGDAKQPETKTFTIVKDQYSAQVFYLETYDPVYGYKCSGGASTGLGAKGNARLVVKACSRQSLKGGEKIGRNPDQQ